MVDHTAATQELHKGPNELHGHIMSHTCFRKLTAMATAVSVSVTVSMGEDRKGVLTEMLRVILESSSTMLAGKLM